MNIKSNSLILTANSFETPQEARQYNVVDIIERIDEDPQPQKILARGRPADLLACVIAVITGFSSFIGATLFFLGFASNAGGLAELVSAFLLSFGLGVFAIIPSVIIAILTYRAWRFKLKIKQAIWTIFLSAPWIMLSVLLFIYAPLPKYMSILAFMLSTLLCLWGLISVFLASKISKFLKDDR